MPRKTELIEPIDGAFEDVVDAVGKSKSKKASARKASHEGNLPLADVELAVAVLEGGTRVIRQAAVFRAFGSTKRGRAAHDTRVLNRPAFLDARNLQPYISKDLEEVLNVIPYEDLDGREAEGYDARILPRICRVYLDARADGALVASQARLARASEVLLLALADLGIEALVDEATGYQYDRKTDALRLLLARYIEEGFQKWLRTFPDSFFVELDRLYGTKTNTPGKRPQHYGHFINRYVYGPIENGYVKNKLNELNIRDDGTRRARFHQWLTEEGRTVLTHQIGRVQGLMEMCPDIQRFKDAADKQKKTSIAPYLFDEMNDPMK